MKSPFPGMDPYLEAHWPDIHAGLIIYSRDQLEEQLPNNLFARVEERVVFETEESAEYWIYPDVRVVEHAMSMSDSASSPRSGVTVTEPVMIAIRPEPATETSLNIIDAKTGRVVSVLEILSLTNKLPGKGQRDYREKQKNLQRQRINLVEIDLLRRGHRVMMVPTGKVPPRARSVYQACVWRAANCGECEVYPLSLRKPLPALRIPLRTEDKDIHLDLQAIIDLAYRKGRYAATLNYAEPPDPPLAAKDAKWAEAMIKKAKKK
jgi:hypothetical protein